MTQKKCELVKLYSIIVKLTFIRISHLKPIFWHISIHYTRHTHIHNNQTLSYDLREYFLMNTPW